MKAAIDPHFGKLLEMMHGQAPADADTDVETKRTGMLALVNQINAGRVLPVDVAVQDIVIDGETGLNGRLYSPISKSGKALPLLVYFHGGGWVTGGLDTHDVQCREMASKIGCIVASVAYRLAPENKFPAALDDAWNAVLTISKNAKDLGADPDKIAIGGDSSGGNLAAAVAIRARDNNGPSIRFQVLICPGLELDPLYPSRIDLAEGFLLTQAEMEWFLDQYLPDGIDRTDPRISPLRADDVSRLPPAIVVTAGFDPLHDEGLAYAARLEEAGSAVARLDFPTLIHGFNPLDNLSPAAAEAMATLMERICEQFEAV